MAVPAASGLTAEPPWGRRPGCKLRSEHTLTHGRAPWLSGCADLTTITVALDSALLGTDQATRTIPRAPLYGEVGDSTLGLADGPACSSQVLDQPSVPDAVTVREQNSVRPDPSADKDHSASLP